MPAAPPAPPLPVRLRRALLRAALAASALLLLLWGSLFLYGSFYFSYVPAIAVERPVHFAFRTDCDPPGPELCSFPSANVSLGGSSKVLKLGQPYRVLLELELPESPVNRALGMFLVSGTSYGPGGRPIATAQRAAMLHYRSRLLRALDTLVFAALFLGGFSEQKQTLQVELFEGYTEDPYVPTERLQLQLQSKRLQIYGARLRLHARLSGVRYLLYHFPLTSAVVGVAGNFALLALLLLLGSLRWGRGGRGERPPGAGRSARAGAAPRGEEPKEEEGPAPTREEPEVLGATEPSAEATPPREEEEETKQEEKEEEAEEEAEEEEEEEEVGGPSPTPPLPPDGHAHPPGPAPRRRLLCSSS